MIPAEPGAYVARYSHKDSGTEATRYSLKPVVAWDETGAALVADPRRGRLVAADSYGNFERILEADSASVVGAIPGGGWLAEYRGESGDTYSISVLAWNVRADGILDPICTDSGGVTGDPTEDTNFVRLYLPADE